MNRTSAFTNNKGQQSNTAEALVRSNKQFREPGLTSFFKASAPDSVSINNGFDLTQIPARPGLHTAPRIQCCAKDGSPCSCVECQQAADSNNNEVEEQVGESTPETLIEHGPAEGASPEQGPTEETSPVTAETPLTEPETETGSAEQATAGLIVDDSVTELSEGQMKKTEFLQKLRSEICNTIGPVLATAGQTTDGCPYLNYWLDLYREKDAAHIESTARKYAPDIKNAKTAEEYISIIAQRALRAAEIWATSGKLSGVPEGVPTTLPNESPAENKQENTVQAKAKGGGVRQTEDPQSIQKELGNGQPLAFDVRSRMESAFGVNLSHVRTHTDSTASSLSNRVNARAFTVGTHVAFGNGEYQPGTLAGDALIAHELAHTIQQSGSERSVDKLEVGSTGYEQLEQDADQTAAGVLSSLWSGAKDGISLKGIGQRVMPTLRSGLKIQRCSDNKKAAPTPAPTPAPAATATATVPAKIRAASTPALMTADRIPPRVDTPVAVKVGGSPAPPGVVFSITGGGSGNGTATINGAATAGLTADGTLNLKGVDQTDPGKAGNLKLAAHQGTTKLAESSGFSVSSVPQNWSTTFVSLPHVPDTLGMLVENCWKSDSTNIADLDKVKRMEQIEVVTSTGIFGGATQGTSSWKDATLGCIHDQHYASPKSAFSGLGKRVTNQVFVFKCERTGVTDIPATNSGFVLTREVSAGAAAGSFNFDISKVGTATTANGFSSGAASGSAIAPTQAV
jgi:hypothetical protein